MDKPSLTEHKEISFFASVMIKIGAKFMFWLSSRGDHRARVDSGRSLQFLPEQGPVPSEISDFITCTHAQSNILHIKYADKIDY